MFVHSSTYTDLMVTLFRPLKADDYKGDDNVEDFGRSIGLLSDYVDAERHGQNTGECTKRYGMCPFSIRSILPKVYSKKASIYFRTKLFIRSN